ncbi:hypothetical protein B566_EDAN009588 [Ephemera danica]|nr:hypothetical protein B566_EDAN009588 [Ephemera danica]
MQLEMGRSCVDHYSEQHRYCVFSHDELVCKMAVQVSTLSIPMAASVCKDMNDMVRFEVALRKELTSWGVVESQRVHFELQPDDERQCDQCQTTVFLSAITCSCKEGKLTCLRHYKDHCDCAPAKKVLLYRYLESELTNNALEVKKTLDDYVQWYNNVREIVYLERKEKPDLSELVDLDVEGEKKKYPHNSTYLALKEAIKEGETTINFLGDFPAEDKMKETELKELTSKAAYLCCKVAHKSILNETLVEVARFHSNAKKVLQSTDDPDTKELQSLIRKGKSMVVWLEEMPQLEQKLRQSQWLDKVYKLDTCSPLSTENEVIQLLEEETQLLPVAPVESAVTYLRTILEQRLVLDAESVPVLLPDLPAVKDLVKKGRDWMNKYKLVKSMDSHPYLEQIDLLVNVGRTLQLQLDPLDPLVDEALRAKNWIEKAGRIFLRKNSHQKLLDALNPRKEVGLQAHKSKRKKFEAVSEKVLDEPPLDNETIFANFQAAKQRELRLMEQLRAKNMYKRLNDTGDTKYCFCNKSYSGTMLDCELCKELYHGKCLLMGKLAPGKGKNALIQQHGDQQVKYLCPCCVRTRRPRIETVLPLLVDLTNLSARLHEGETLQCLTENAIHWQERAKAALATDEVASALAKLSVMNQRVLEAEARRKTERIISSELKKAASNPELQGHLHAISPMSGISSEDSIETDQDFKTPGLLKEERDDCLQDMDMDSMQDENMEDEDMKESFSCSEHAYSTASKPGGGLSSLARKHCRKTPLVPRHPPTKLQLSEGVRCMLESLMMEGDLLEVSLDETQHIWRILHASSPSHKPLCYENLDSSLQASKLQSQLLNKAKLKKPKKEGGVVEGKNKLKVVLGKEKQKRQPMVKKVKPKRKLEIGLDGETIKPVKQRRIRKPKPKQDPKEGDEDGDDDDGSDEACAAHPCQRPTGDEVTWVQCDLCTEWYHLLCEDLKKSDINSTDDYICKNCKKSSAPSTAPLTEAPQEMWNDNVPKVDWSTPLGI